MESIEIPIKLYSIDHALTFLERLGLKRCDTWLRNQMKRENLKIYHVGKSDFVTETDLYKISLSPKAKRGPKSRPAG